MLYILGEDTASCARCLRSAFPSVFRWIVNLSSSFLIKADKDVPSLTVLFTLIHVFGIWLTAARLYSQKLTKRLWWDDYAIAISAAFDLGYIPLIWLTYAPVGLFLSILGGVSI